MRHQQVIVKLCLLPGYDDLEVNGVPPTVMLCSFGNQSLLDRHPKVAVSQCTLLLQSKAPLPRPEDNHQIKAFQALPLNHWWQKMIIFVMPTLRCILNG